MFWRLQADPAKPKHAPCRLLRGSRTLTRLPHRRLLLQLNGVPGVSGVIPCSKLHSYISQVSLLPSV